MPRLDLSCKRCEHILNDIIVDQSQMLGSGLVNGIDCPACGNDIFNVYWGNGTAPAVTVQITDQDELFKKCKTIGEYWDRRGVQPGSKENKESSAKRIKKLRKKKK